MTAGSTGTGGPGSSPVVQPESASATTIRKPPTNRISLLPAGGVADIELLAGLAKRLGLLAQAGIHRVGRGDPLRRRVLAHVLRDLHRAEVRAAHRAEVRPFGRGRRQRLVVEL